MRLTRVKTVCAYYQHSGHCTTPSKKENEWSLAAPFIYILDYIIPGMPPMPPIPPMPPSAPGGGPEVALAAMTSSILKII